MIIMMIMIMIIMIIIVPRVVPVQEGTHLQACDIAARLNNTNATNNNDTNTMIMQN